MRLSPAIPAFVVLIPLALAGCGNSTSSSPPPALPHSAGSASAQVAAPLAPLRGAFVEMPSRRLQQAMRTTTNCNLDAVDDKPAGVMPVPRAGSATFAGWAGDDKTGTVPDKLDLVLTGQQDYAVETDTGVPRPDVAKAQNVPAFATSGYAVQADLSAVAAGKYGVTLLYSADGQVLRCTTHVELSVR